MERASGNNIFKVYLYELEQLRQLVTALNRQIRILVRTDEYNANVQLLKTVPGISTLTATTLLTELFNIDRFPSFDKLASCIGLIPDTDSSGETNIKKA
jgi:transposase